MHCHTYARTRSLCESWTDTFASHYDADWYCSGFDLPLHQCAAHSLLPARTVSGRQNLEISVEINNGVNIVIISAEVKMCHKESFIRPSDVFFHDCRPQVAAQGLLSKEDHRVLFLRGVREHAAVGYLVEGICVADQDRMDIHSQAIGARVHACKKG